MDSAGRRRFDADALTTQRIGTKKPAVTTLSYTTQVELLS